MLLDLLLHGHIQAWQPQIAIDTLTYTWPGSIAAALSVPSKLYAYLALSNAACLQCAVLISFLSVICTLLAAKATW